MRKVKQVKPLVNKNINFNSDHKKVIKQIRLAGKKQNIKI